MSVEVRCALCGKPKRKPPSEVHRRNAVGVDVPHFTGGTSLTRGYIRLLSKADHTREHWEAAV